MWRTWRSLQWSGEVRTVTHGFLTVLCFNMLRLSPADFLDPLLPTSHPEPSNLFVFPTQQCDQWEPSASILATSPGGKSEDYLEQAGHLINPQAAKLFRDSRDQGCTEWRKWTLRDSGVNTALRQKIFHWLSHPVRKARQDSGCTQQVPFVTHCSATVSAGSQHNSAWKQTTYPKTSRWRTFLDSLLFFFVCFLLLLFLLFFFFVFWFFVLFVTYI